MDALQNRCYMCISWTRVLYSVVITWQSNPPVSQFFSLWNVFKSVWSMFVYNTSCSTSCWSWSDLMSLTRKCPSRCKTLMWYFTLLHLKLLPKSQKLTTLIIYESPGQHWKWLWYKTVHLWFIFYKDVEHATITIRNDICCNIIVEIEEKRGSKFQHFNTSFN